MREGRGGERGEGEVREGREGRGGERGEGRWERSRSPET